MPVPKNPSKDGGSVKLWPKEYQPVTYPVALSCGCSLSFPKPVQEKGDVIWCRSHDKAVTVQ
jgi:hypothetical protein